MRSLLIGTWQLICCETRDSHGQVFEPWGKNAVGWLIYTVEGYVSVTIMRGDRASCGLEHIEHATLEEKAQLVDGYGSYVGLYEIQENKIFHHVKASLFPNWVATVQERFFHFNNKDLVLYATTAWDEEHFQTDTLIWRKVTR